MDKNPFLSKTNWGPVIMAAPALLSLVGVDVGADTVNDVANGAFLLLGAFTTWKGRRDVGKKLVDKRGY